MQFSKVPEITYSVLSQKTSAQSCVMVGEWQLSAQAELGKESGGQTAYLLLDFETTLFPLVPSLLLGPGVGTTNS